MGHGDSICFADANFPSENLTSPGKPGPLTVRADGHEVAPLLRAVSKLFPLDTYTEFPVQMMAAVPGDELDVSIEERFSTAVEAEQVSLFPDSGAVVFPRLRRLSSMTTKCWSRCKSR